MSQMFSSRTVILEGTASETCTLEPDLAGRFTILSSRNFLSSKARSEFSPSLSVASNF